MNIITNPLPQTLQICGKICPIKSDFKTWIKVGENLEKLNAQSPQVLGIIFKEVFYNLPPNLLAAMQEIVKFYNPSFQKTPKVRRQNCHQKVYDFAYDAELIYAAFLEQYNIDLIKSEMHWWQFLALFKALNEASTFMKAVCYRSINLSQIKNSAQKKFLRRMKAAYQLPQNGEEKENVEKALSQIFGELG